MARFYGKIGFSKTENTSPGVFEEVITEKSYSGTRKKSKMAWEPGMGLNDDLDINERISIIADGFARLNYGYVRYVIVDNVRWKAKSLDYLYPRLDITLGGVYNGPIPIITPD